jgi:cytochrome c oxidase assembly protein subunit 15
MIWFQRILVITTILTLCVVVFGSYVRLTDAGLGCPDWPGCYGTLTVPQSEEAISQALQQFPDSMVETDKAWIEMIHRYIAGILGLLILFIAVKSYKLRDEIKTTLKLPFFILALVCLQAILGMWTVTKLLQPAIVTTHLIGGMTILGLMTYMTHRQLGTQINNFSINTHTITIARLSIFVLFIQILLGGWTSTNYAALACTDYPTCHGALIPDMNFKDGFSIFRELGMTSSGEELSLQALHAIQWVHRMGAIVLTALVLYLFYLLRNFPGLGFYRNLLLILISVQFVVGIANLLLHLPIALATIHNLGAALLVIILVVINSRLTPQYD